MLEALLRMHPILIQVKVEIKIEKNKPFFFLSLKVFSTRECSIVFLIWYQNLKTKTKNAEPT